MRVCHWWRRQYHKGRVEQGGGAQQWLMLALWQQKQWTKKSLYDKLKVLHEGVRIVVEMHQVCSEVAGGVCSFYYLLDSSCKTDLGEEEIAVSLWCLLPEGKGTGALGPVIWTLKQAPMCSASHSCPGCGVRAASVLLQQLCHLYSFWEGCQHALS